MGLEKHSSSPQEELNLLTAYKEFNKAMKGSRCARAQSHRSTGDYELIM